MKRHQKLALLAVAALLAACNDAPETPDPAKAAGSESPSTPPVVADDPVASDPPRAAATATTGCEPVSGAVSTDLPNGAERPTEVTGDIDGDGTDDTLSTWQLTMGDEEVLHHLHVATASGYADQAEIVGASSMANIRPLGTVPIGDGLMAALVVEGVGASAELVSLWGLHDFTDEPCSLARLTVGDDSAPLAYPVGGTAGNASGMRCTEVDGVPALAVTTITPASDGVGDFAWESQVLQWSGAGALDVVDTRSGTESIDKIAEYSGINCPGINLD